MQSDSYQKNYLDYNGRLELNCTAEPMAIYSWTKDGKSLIANASRSIMFEENGERLIITSMTQDSQCDYVCHVRNAAGSKTKLWTVTVGDFSLFQIFDYFRVMRVIAVSFGGFILILISMILCLLYKWRQQKV